MAAVSLLWDTNMAAVTSCENTLYGQFYNTDTSLRPFGVCVNIQVLLRTSTSISGWSFRYRSLPSQHINQEPIRLLYKLRSRNATLFTSKRTNILEIRLGKNLAKLTGSAVRINCKKPKGKKKDERKKKGYSHARVRTELPSDYLQRNWPLGHATTAPITGQS